MRNHVYAVCEQQLVCTNVCHELVSFTEHIPYTNLSFFIKACHLLALVLVQSFASGIEDSFWTSTIRWLIAEYALSYPWKRTLSIRCGVPSVFRCT